MADAVSHASYLPPILTFCTGAVIAVPLFRKLGLSAVLGYLAAGVVIGPSLLGVIKDPDAIRGALLGVIDPELRRPVVALSYRDQPGETRIEMHFRLWPSRPGPAWPAGQESFDSVQKR